MDISDSADKLSVKKKLKKTYIVTILMLLLGQFQVIIVMEMWAKDLI